MGESTLEVIPAWEGELRERAKNLSRDIDEGYWELSRILYDVYDKTRDGATTSPPLYASWGYSSFGDYAEQELGLHRRKAMYLRRIWYRLVVELQLPEDKLNALKKLGWAKLKEIERVLTNDNVDEWIERGNKLNLREVEEFVRIGGQISASDQVSETEKAAMGLEPVKSVHFKTFVMNDDEKADIDRAMLLAQKITGIFNDTTNLRAMSIDFAGTNQMELDDKETRLMYLGKIERLVGFRLIAIDPKDGEVVFGLPVLEALSKGEPIPVIPQEESKKETLNVGAQQEGAIF